VTADDAPATLPADADEAERESKGERTRRRLLDLAVAQFGRHGYRSTSVSEITRAAGLTQAASYAYFDNKEALFRAAVDDDAGSLIRSAMAKVEDTAAAQLVPALLVHLADGLADHPLVQRVLAGQEPDAMDQLVDLPAMAHAIDHIGERLAAAQREGEIRADIDPKAVATGAGSICLALLTSMTQGTGQSRDDVILGVLAVFDAMVQPPA
jgi:AcrR family transcriptional regulator